MKVSEIKEVANKNGFNFEKFHDFRGINDRWKENHSVLVFPNVDSIKVIAQNTAKTKWKVIGTTDNGWIDLVVGKTLQECLTFCLEELDIYFLQGK